MTTDKIAPEMAEQEFDRWAEGMGLDLDTSNMDEADAAALGKQRGRIVLGIVQGSVVVNESDEIEFTPQRVASKSKDTIVFHERSGASLMAMDHKKKGHEVAKMYAVLGEMCGVPPKVFAGLVGPDIKMCESIFSLLMD